jgi:enolase
MKIKGVDASTILDSRNQKTILVTIKTNVGNFSSSSPSGKSTGKFEKKTYKKNIEEDAKTIKQFSEYFSDENFNTFIDLKKIEDIIKSAVGANTLFSLEASVLKAIAKEQKKEVWQIVDLENKEKKEKKFPRLVGNVIGGGKHSFMKEEIRKPDFQEFLLIPKQEKISKQLETMKKIKKEVEEKLKKKDEHFSQEKNDEDAWKTSLNEKEIFEILNEFGENIGTDIASSEFYKRKKYYYENPKLDRTKEEQFFYLKNLIKNFNLFYIEDPFEEEDFESFSKLLKEFPKSLIVGDDLTVTNVKRLEKAIEKKSINAIIVKPNQTGSLLEVKKVCELAKKNKIKIIFSHRSGETKETILADLAFGFQADFFKCGVTGNEREAKIKRFIEIQEKLK